MKHRLLKQFSLHGVLPRAKVKNNLSSLNSMIRQGYVKKIHQGHRVYYALTEKALPLLDCYRVQLLAEAQMRRALYPRRAPVYDALLEDLRFFDTFNKDAQDFLFLGDWRLSRPPNASQLELSQYRYYLRDGVVP